MKYWMNLMSVFGYTMITAFDQLLWNKNNPLAASNSFDAASEGMSSAIGKATSKGEH